MLSLKYAFLPSPNPIMVSVPGAAASVIDLAVLVTNPTVDPIPLNEIQLQIPVGDKNAAYLSVAPNLPPPVAGILPGWTATAAGSVVTLVPTAGGTASVADTLSFTLPGIPVNAEAGTVQVTITEFGPPPAGKRIDATTYTLVKWPADVPVTGFTACPAIAVEPDQTVTLGWTCSSQGGSYVYALTSDGGWAPGDCLQGGNCYTCADGAAGVQTPPLQQTTTFTLQVIQADRAGPRVVVQALELTVPLLLPSISQQSYAEQLPVVGGRILRLHWLALNAEYCRVVTDSGAVLAARAPADTFVSGFAVLLGVGKHGLWIEAYAAQGSVPARLPVGTFTAVDSSTVALPVPPSGVAITPDGTQAWMTANPTAASPGALVPVDLLNSTAGAPYYPYLKYVASPWLVMSPTTRLYVIACATVTTSICYMSGETGEWYYAALPTCFAFTPGDQALLAGCSDGTLLPLPLPPPDPGSYSPAGQRAGGVPSALAISAPPGGAVLALALLPAQSQVAVFDVAPGVFENAAIPVPATPGAIAATPDGSVALVAGAVPGAAAGTVTVVDLPNRTALPGVIPVGAGPWAIAVTPDSAFAFVANHGDATLTVIDVPGRAALLSVSVPAGPAALAVSPDGTRLVVACDTSSTVIVFPSAPAA